MEVVVRRAMNRARVESPGNHLHRHLRRLRRLRSIRCSNPTPALAPSHPRLLSTFIVQFPPTIVSFLPSFFFFFFNRDYSWKKCVASYQVWCRPRGQRPVDTEIEVVRTVIWTLRDKGGSSRLNNHVEGPLLPHFRPHLDSHLRRLIPCSPLSRNCRYSNLNMHKHHPRYNYLL